MEKSSFDTIDRVAQRTTSAVVARAGTKSLALREFLASAMIDSGQPASFMQEPQIEAAHGYVAADVKLEDLAGNLLQRELIDALDGGDKPEIGDRERYRFRRSWHPFRHQIEAWKELLSPNPRSVVVTSGTGSGKTECFLIPLLNSLVEQSLAGQTMIGVQAIILYPLNALINSQHERLSDWTSPFRGKVKFALFNGETLQTAQEIERKRRPEEVIDRTTLRAAPPPILVTNIIMLEYMLVRFEDSPILQRSRGKLRYIILDEAHSYVGSQAAELSLLLRRVLHAFGVEPQNVRFVATSATIGRHGDPQTRGGLRKFLSQVAGIAESQVTVIEGERKIPELPKLNPSATLPTEYEIRSLVTLPRNDGHL
jgi:DEAD/DEAH box helicase domain-containing protein